MSDLQVVGILGTLFFGLIVGVLILIYFAAQQHTEQQSNIESYIKKHQCVVSGIAHDYSRSGTRIRDVYKCENGNIVIY